MPTFTAIALDRLLEPGASKTVDKTVASSNPVPKPKFPPKPRRVPNSALERRNSTSATERKVGRPQISPALYATPEATPLPDSPSSFPPSPYIINHKRRGPRLLKSFSEDDVASRRKTLDEDEVNGNVKNSDNSVVDSTKDHTSTSSVSDSVEEKDVNCVQDSPIKGDIANGDHEIPSVGEHKNGVHDGERGSIDGDLKSRNARNGLAMEKDVLKLVALDSERDGDSEDFFDPQESMSYSSNTDGEDNSVVESSVKFAATPSTGEFYDAWEELSSESGHQTSIHDNEAELRKMRLSSSGASSTSASSAVGVRLFGVRLTDGSIIKKSASMGNLSAHYHSSSSAAASPNPDSPSSDHVRDSGNVPEGYLSDDPVHASSSTNRRGERKKGVPWTEEEHRLFLVGLQKLGKGDWRGIARNYVVSRTPTQVASHAQKYFIRQSNSTRRKRRSSLFDMVADMATEPQTVPEDQELPSFHLRERDNADSLPSLNLSLKPEYEPMETTTDEPGKEPDDTVTDSSESKQTVPKLSAFNPTVPPLKDFTQDVPGFYSAYMPIPYPFWPANAASLEVKREETSNHEVLKPVPTFPKQPVNVNELVGLSHLSIAETEREPSPLSLKLIGEPTRQSAFHANASAVG